MKIRLSFKTPDVTDQIEREDQEAAEAVIGKFVRDGEYVTIEVDTDNITAVVIPQN